MRKKRDTRIPVIDLFAGPGGLGEGFSKSGESDNKHHFKVCLSIECDHYAHLTLELRSLFHQFEANDIPGHYYIHLDPTQGEWLVELGEDLIEELFENEEESPELQIDTDEHRTNEGEIAIYLYSFVVQLKKLRAEIDTKTKEGIRDRTLEWLPASRNRKDSLVGLRGLAPCWLTHEWRAL